MYSIDDMWTCMNGDDASSQYGTSSQWSGSHNGRYVWSQTNGVSSFDLGGEDMSNVRMLSSLDAHIEVDDVSMNDDNLEHRSIPNTHADTPKLQR